MRRQLILILVFIMNISQVFAATYYVDYSAGDDTNNGTTTGTPFKYHPWDSRATDTSNSTTLNAGDSVLFNRGVVYDATGLAYNSTMCSIEDDGSNASPITMGAYGTGDDPIIVGGIALDETQFSNESGNVYVAAKADLGLAGITLFGLFEGANHSDFTYKRDAYYPESALEDVDGPCEFYDDGTDLYIYMSDSGSPAAADDLYAYWVNYAL